MVFLIVLMKVQLGPSLISGNPAQAFDQLAFTRQSVIRGSALNCWRPYTVS